MEQKTKLTEQQQEAISEIEGIKKILEREETINILIKGEHTQGNLYTFAGLVQEINEIIRSNELGEELKNIFLIKKAITKDDYIYNLSLRKEYKGLDDFLEKAYSHNEKMLKDQILIIEDFLKNMEK